MGCLVALAALVSPRLALILLAIFTDLVDESFDGEWFLPVLGFFVLPWTTLAWAVIVGLSDQISPFGILLVAFAFFVDLYSYGKSQAVRSQRSG
ncbi:MAG: hypothetical protein ACO3ZZ_02485 [Solirubrobacterales bacterium]|jgi:hypothetical protein